MQVSDFLSEQRIAFERIVHPPAFTAQKRSKFLGVSGKRVSNAVLLAGPAGDEGRGLTDHPKRLSCRFFYDQEGSRLFEEICALPEYYLTRAERAIFEARAEKLAARFPAGVCLVELGSGNASKTRLLIEA